MVSNKKHSQSIQVNEEFMPFVKSYGAGPIPYDVNSAKVNNIYGKGTSLAIRQDLVDTDIAICTPEVLDHFNDNFDKSDFKDNFINWLYESEIIEDRIRAFEVCKQGSYAARISDPRIYGIVTKDILSRKVYPFVLDKATIDHNADYNYKMTSIYIDKRAHVNVQAQIFNNSAIGEKSTIDSHTFIKNSTIGRDCKIGKYVKITNSIIHKDVIIEDDCQITNSIISSGSKLLKGCQLNSGTMIAENVVVKERAIVPAGSIGSLMNYSSETKKFTLIGAKDPL